MPIAFCESAAAKISFKRNIFLINSEMCAYFVKLINFVEFD